MPRLRKPGMIPVKRPGLRSQREAIITGSMDKVNELEWVTVSSNTNYTYKKAKVPGGYLVQVTAYVGISITFVPDPEAL